MTVLHLAAENGRLDCVRLLVQNGAEADKLSRSGKTARALAQENNHAEIVQFLDGDLAPVARSIKSLHSAVIVH